MFSLMGFSPTAFLKSSLSHAQKIKIHYGLIRAQYAFDFGRNVTCNICGRMYSSFASFNGRANAMCPSCFSLERHRLLYFYLLNQPDIFRKKIKLLHFAPEKCLSTKLKAHDNIDYTTADLMNQFIDMIEVKPDRIMSVTEITDPDETYDAVICNHVLEHVPDDRRAMQEICRVLKLGGFAILQVPINFNSDQTQEDLTLSRDERRKYYGSPDHLRFYAEPDYVKRLQSVGFEVDVNRYVDRLDAARYVLNPKEAIYVCTKRPA